MSSVNSLKKKCRHLEDRGRWADLSRTCSDLARLLRNEKKLDEALLYYRKDRDLCIKLRDEVEEAEGVLRNDKVCNIFSLFNFFSDENDWRSVGRAG